MSAHVLNPTILVEHIISTCGSSKILCVGSDLSRLIKSFISRGVDVYGHFPSVDAGDTAIQGRVTTGPYSHIPVADFSFQTVICAFDAAVSEDEQLLSILEICRVTKRFLYLHITYSEHRSIRWWEGKLFDAGFRKHPLLFEILQLNYIDADSFTMLFEKIPHIHETDLHLLHDKGSQQPLDMLRITGSFSNAACFRYFFFRWHIRQNDTVVHLNCGTGYGSAIIWDASLASKVVGVDASHAAIKYAQDSYSPHRGDLSFIHNPDVSVPPLENLADIVFWDCSLHPDLLPTELLSDIRAAMIPGGRLVWFLPTTVFSDTNVDIFQKFFIFEQIFHQLPTGDIVGKSSIHPPSTPNDHPVMLILVGMKSPLLGRKEDYVETFYPQDIYKNSNVVSWGRDYDNPWLFRALVHTGWRLKSKAALKELALDVITKAIPDSPDKGAALCVLGYQYLEDLDKAKRLGWLVNEIRKYIDITEQSLNPHVVRWRISNQYLLAKLSQANGKLSEACKEFWLCAQMDFGQFCPLIATKSVESAFEAGWLFMNVLCDVTMAKVAWRKGIQTAKIATNGSWKEILGNHEEPFDFGLHEITQIIDLADRCAKALHFSRQFTGRPGKSISLIFSNQADSFRAKQHWDLEAHNQQVIELLRQLKNMGERESQSTKQLMQTEQKLRDNQLEHNRQLSETTRIVHDLNEKIATVELELKELITSKSWRITHPLRFIRNLFR